MADQAEGPDTSGGQVPLDGPGSGPGQDDAVQVSNSVSGTTVHGPVVQAGSIGTFIHHAPPPTARAEVAWPLRIGAVPDLATAHQPRTALREQIHRAQSAAGTVVLSQVLSGGGGVGKTQLAAALAHHAGHDGTDLVLWADATRAEQVLGAYAQAALLVQAPGATGQDVESDARAFLNWAATTGRSWLIILDDVTEPDALRSWWPPTGAHGAGEGQPPGAREAAGPQHRAVVTTRLKGADISGGGRHVLDISTYTAAESAAFLRERLVLADAGHLLDEAVDDVGTVLGHLPLALGYAAAWMINEDQPCGTYVRHFRDQKRRLGQVLPARWSGEAYDREIAVALLLSLDAAQAAEPVGLARPALDLAAFLDPAGHPAEFWQTDAVTGYLTRTRTGAAAAGDGGGRGRERDRDTDPAVLAGAGALGPDVREEAVGSGGDAERVPVVDAATARRAMRLLHRYGLISTRRDDPQRTVRIHALTARAAREALPEPGRGVVVGAVADGLLELWPEEDQHDMARAAVLRANTDHLYPLAGDHLCSRHAGVHGVLSRAGESHVLSGLPGLAVAYWESQAAHAQRQFGAEHSDTLTARANLALSYQAAGRTSEAIELQEQILADREHLLGHHPHTLTTRANLATSYREAGRTSEAIELLERVLADSEHLLGPQHPHTLTIRAHLAASYWTAGRTSEAIELQAQVLADSEHLLGPQHPHTLTARANIAHSYRDAGRTSEAIELLEQVLADHEHLLGPQHPETLDTRDNLAVSYHGTGRRGEAVGLLARVVEDSRQVLGEEHPRTRARVERLRRWREQDTSPQPGQD
ncbi:tetratricopeptide repeat protein [Streptomyces sp. NPDC050504]|uniref:tetratricopeptide repeat protein n=1 Tax=Streptomyces sp. NPDC050504 TaxID=3365618 RepID=UPI0037A0105F